MKLCNNDNLIKKDSDVRKNQITNKNAFCDVLLYILSKKAESSQVLEIEDELYKLNQTEILKYLNMTEKELAVQVEKIIDKNMEKGVDEVNFITPFPEICEKIMKEKNIIGRIFIPSFMVTEKNIKQFIKIQNIGVIIDLLLDEDEKCNEISNLSAKYNLPIIIKLYDDLEKTGKLDSLYNMSPTNYIESIGLLDRCCYIYGAIHADKDDFTTWAGYGAKVIISPTSFLRLGQGIVNIKALEDAGLEIEFGSGGETEMDIKKEKELAVLLTRGILNDASVN